MLYIVQFYAEQQARGVNHQRVSLSFRVMEKPDALHKINDSTHKDTEYNTLDVKTYPQSGLLFVYLQVMESQHVSARVKRRAAVR